MSDLTIVVNILLAFSLGGVIGWFREKEGRAAGMRTHILVALGSALFMTSSIQMAAVHAGADPARLAAGVVTGIGFIGAGCILQTGSGVKGITTAASIFITSAIGLSSGAGFYLSSITGAALTIVALEVVREVEIHIIKTKPRE
jgi:putative Mg2+ transporter-C (MgtC) family protein